MKICLACSGGGHLSELMQLRDFYRKREHFFLTFRRPNSDELAKNEKTYFVTDPKRNPFALVLNFFQSLKVFMKEKPDVVLTGEVLRRGVLNGQKNIRDSWNAHPAVRQAAEGG